MIHDLNERDRDHQRPRNRCRMETPEPSRPIDENKRTIFAEHFETELNLDLLMGNDVRDSKRRAVIQFFDSETGLPIKTMHFSRKLPKVSQHLRFRSKI